VELTTTLAIFAVVAALGMLGVVGVNVLLTIQEVDAEPRPTKGCNRSIAYNASEGRCYQGLR